MRLPRSFALASVTTLLLAAACGGDDGETAVAPDPKAGSGGASAPAVGGSAGTAARAGSAGAATGGRAGAAAGSAGNKAGGAGGTGAAGGTGGSAGTAGAAGAGNSGGTAAGAAGSSGAGGAGAGAGGSAGQGGAAGGSGSSAGSAGTAGAGGGACSVASCKEGTCLGAVCCALSKVCGASCCGAADTCSFGVCVAPGKTCGDADDCGVTEFCDFSGKKTNPPAPGTCGGATAPEGNCLPRPPQCPGTNDPGAGTTCVQACQFKPASIKVEPVLTHYWGDPASVTDNVMMAPIVIQLDDDDCDKKVTAKDVPEIVFTSFSNGVYQYSGILHVTTTAGAKDKKLVQKWQADHVFPNRQLAAGNIDGKPGNEVVACVHLDEPTIGPDKKPVAPVQIATRAYEGATGKVIWTSVGACSMPAIADLDQDGKPEVISTAGVLDGATGKLKFAFEGGLNGDYAVSDIDGDGKLDIVSGTEAHTGAGKLIGAVPAASLAKGARAPAVADLDGDGIPEIITGQFNIHELLVWHWDPKTKAAVVIRDGIDINKDLFPGNCKDGSAGFTRGGGPATAGDFDKDGFPDVALAGGVAYAVFSGKLLMDKKVTNPKTFLWAAKTQDCSSASTGSSLFDFDGDGRAEVVYADEVTLHVYEGATGKELFTTCNTNGTLQEYPLVADVNADGHADLVVVSNSYSGFNCSTVKTTGVRVFSDNRWVRTRRVWNQHAYSVTNIEEDGTVPKVEKTNWKDDELNNFRQNKQPGSEFSAPDAIVSLAYPVCSGAYVIKARITNVGEAPLPAGVVVGLHTGAPPGGPQIATALTTGILYPAQSETVDLPVADAVVATSLSSGATPYFVVVDDTKVPHPEWTECRADNNVSKSLSGSCSKD